MEELQKQLRQCDGGYNTVPKRLSYSLGGNAALILSQLCSQYDYWNKNNGINSNGEFYCTEFDMETATGVKRKAQDTAIRRLKDKGFIQTVNNKGTPPVRYFKLSDNLTDLINQYCKEARDDILIAKSKNIKKIQDYKKTFEDTINKPKCTNVHFKTYKKPFQNVQMDILNCTKGHQTRTETKTENIKTDKKENVVCLSALEIKNKEYLINELSNRLNISSDIISKKIEKAVQDTHHSYSDLKLAYEFKEETINWLLNGNTSNYDNDRKANTIIKAIKNGIEDALKQDEKQQAEYEEINRNNSFDSHFNISKIQEKIYQQQKNESKNYDILDQL